MRFEVGILTMKFSDIILMGFANLRRTKLRAFLTILGVVVGIGALTSMISFGTGMQKNVTDTFTDNSLFLQMNVTSERINAEAMFGGNQIQDTAEQQKVPLTDSIFEIIKKIEGVDIAFPEITFAVKLKINDNETTTNAQALPAKMGEFKPYNELLGGDFYTTDSSENVIVSWWILKRMKLLVNDPEQQVILSAEDSAQGMKIVPVDSVIGKTIKVITSSVNIPKPGFGAMMGGSNQPFKQNTGEFVIGGIIKRRSSFNMGSLQSNIIIPVKTAEKIPKLNFSNVWDLLSRDSRKGKYSSLNVRVKKMSDMEFVREKIENMGLFTFALSDGLEEARRGFLILDAILAAIGTIALFVAALGIINTMIMAILERRKEIGIMKSVGGSENQIKWIFITEAAVIGFVGAIFGLGLGWVVTRIANYIVNLQLPVGEETVELFYFPMWLILGAIGFSILLSVLAGLFPANRAARVDPVEALRHN